MNIKHIYLGTKRVTKIFRGLVLIWQENDYTYMRIDDSLVLRQLALLSSHTGEPVTIEYSELLQHNNEATSAPATLPDTEAKELFDEGFVSESVPATISIVAFDELFSNNGLNPEAKLGVDTISYDKLLFANGMEYKQADTSKAKTEDAICFVSSFDVTNTRVLEAFVDRQEIIRYKAWAHDYLESHGEAKYQLVLVSSFSGDTAGIEEAGSAEILVFVSTVTGDSTSTQLAESHNTLVFQLTDSSEAGHGSIAASLLQLVVNPKAIASPGVGSSAESTLELKSMMYADAYPGIGSDSTSQVVMYATYNAEAQTGIGSIAESAIDFQNTTLAGAVSVGLVFPIAKLKMQFKLNAEAEALNITEAAVGVLEKIIQSVEASVGTAQTTEAYEKQVHVYSATADIGTGVTASAIYNTVQNILASAEQGTGQASTLIDKVTMLHNAIATSLFVWIYPVWTSDDTLYIRCGHPVTQEGDTVIFGEVT